MKKLIIICAVFVLSFDGDATSPSTTEGVSLSSQTRATAPVSPSDVSATSSLSASDPASSMEGSATSQDLETISFEDESEDEKDTTPALPLPEMDSNFISYVECKEEGVGYYVHKLTRDESGSATVLSRKLTDYDEGLRLMRIEGVCYPQTIEEIRTKLASRSSREKFKEQMSNQAIRFIFPFLNKRNDLVEQELGKFRNFANLFEPLVFSGKQKMIDYWESAYDSEFYSLVRACEKGGMDEYIAIIPDLGEELKSIFAILKPSPRPPYLGEAFEY